MKLEFRRDDLTGEQTQDLVRRHLAGMHQYSPACSVHALDVDRLRQPGVTFFSAWDGDTIVCMGALKRIDDAKGELKSMRVADAYLGKGAGRAMLNHLMEEARRCGFTSLWLETGSAPAFVPAIRMYESAGFRQCGPFEGYTLDPFSIYMMRTI